MAAREEENELAADDAAAGSHRTRAIHLDACAMLQAIPKVGTKLVWYLLPAGGDEGDEWSDDVQLGMEAFLAADVHSDINGGLGGSNRIPATTRDHGYTVTEEMQNKSGARVMTTTPTTTTDPVKWKRFSGTTVTATSDEWKRFSEVAPTTAQGGVTVSPYLCETVPDVTTGEGSTNFKDQATST